MSEQPLKWNVLLLKIVSPTPIPKIPSGINLCCNGFNLYRGYTYALLWSKSTCILCKVFWKWCVDFTGFL